MLAAHPRSILVKVHPTTRNATCAAHCARLNGGSIAIFAGIKPANASAPPSGNTLLATLYFALVAFGAPAAGTATANAIAQATSVALGTATWARCCMADGITVVCDFSIGLPGSGKDMELTDVTIVPGVPVTCTSATITYPDGT